MVHSQINGKSYDDHHFAFAEKQTNSENSRPVLPLSFRVRRAQGGLKPEKGGGTPPSPGAIAS